MRLGQRIGWGHVLLVTVGLVAALMLIPAGPSDDDTPRTSRLFSTSPDLQRFLDDAAQVAPGAPTSEEVIATVGARPEIVRPELEIAVAAPAAEELDETETASVPPEVPIDSTTVRTAVNMREGPSTNNPTLFVLQPDEKVAILERDGGWARVRRDDGATGWVYARYLGDAPAEARTPTSRRAAPDTPTQSRASSGTELASLRLRSGPSQLSRVLLVVEPGTPLRVAERRSGWVRVVLPDGVSGWIRTN